MNLLHFLPEKHLTFKWDEALSFERGCASIQYAHARACKLLKKSGKDVSSLAVSDDWVPNENEKDLIRTIAKFPQVIEDCANKKRIHNITQYCQDLARAFNHFTFFLYYFKKCFRYFRSSSSSKNVNEL